MALTPLDIQNKNFSSKMRGYNPDDVDDFLDQVAKDYEDSLHRARELEKSLKHAEEKLQYFNELKDALNQSIIVAQDTADKVKTSASKESEMIVTTAESTANELVVNAEKRSNQLISEAEEKATSILTEAIDRARQLATETDDLKKKTRVFHQHLSLMLETQLEQVKSDEWNELLKPFSSYVGDKHQVVREILEKDYEEQSLEDEYHDLYEEPENMDLNADESVVLHEDKVSHDSLNTEPDLNKYE